MHNKFVERLANIYINKLMKEGGESAKEWSERILSKETVGVVAERVRIILNTRKRT